MKTHKIWKLGVSLLVGLLLAMWNVVPYAMAGDLVCSYVESPYAGERVSKNVHVVIEVFFADILNLNKKNVKVEYGDGKLKGVNFTYAKGSDIRMPKRGIGDFYVEEVLRATIKSKLEGRVKDVKCTVWYNKMGDL